WKVEKVWRREVKEDLGCRQGQWNLNEGGTPIDRTSGKYDPPHRKRPDNHEEHDSTRRKYNPPYQKYSDSHEEDDSNSTSPPTSESSSGISDRSGRKNAPPPRDGFDSDEEINRNTSSPFAGSSSSGYRTPEIVDIEQTARPTERSTQYSYTLNASSSAQYSPSGYAKPKQTTSASSVRELLEKNNISEAQAKLSTFGLFSEARETTNDQPCIIKARTGSCPLERFCPFAASHGWNFPDLRIASICTAKCDRSACSRLHLNIEEERLVFETYGADMQRRISSELKNKYEEKAAQERLAREAEVSQYQTLVTDLRNKITTERNQASVEAKEQLCHLNNAKALLNESRKEVAELKVALKTKEEESDGFKSKIQQMRTSVMESIFGYMQKLNYYQLLKIDQTANLSEINKAYKKLSLQFHPDKGG
ncbi:hypothetical protein BT69DRAFT_1288588, partial [Atractiella rhizophila]